MTAIGVFQDKGAEIEHKFMGPMGLQDWLLSHCFDLERALSNRYKLMADIMYYIENMIANDRELGYYITNDELKSNQEKIDMMIRWIINNGYGIFSMTGKKGCLPKGTLIRTPYGIRPIEKIKDFVLSYNFLTNKIESKKTTLYDSGKKQVVKIHTRKGIIKCSPKHKWFTNNGLKETEYLNAHDKLLYI